MRPWFWVHLYVFDHLCLVFMFMSCLQNVGSDTLSNTIITTHGTIQGSSSSVKTRWKSSETEMIVDTFWGIPFAEPPVGERRFKNPVPFPAWDGVKDATHPPKSCMQVAQDRPAYGDVLLTEVSEDCLYLNVWRPRCPPQDAGGSLATMVWIYGGGYTTGSTAMPLYNGETLAAFSCTIVASINYRLGAFGFLYLNSTDVPGNMGLRDQILAIQWIKSNVEHFGGDPNSITLFGNSAGGASIGIHVLSPLASGLFNRAIIQSGTATGILSSSSADAALALGQDFVLNVGCGGGSNATEMMQCLRQVDAHLLTRVHFETATDFSRQMTFVVDSSLLPAPQLSLMRDGKFKACPLLLGTTKDEGTGPLAMMFPEDYSLYSEPDICFSQQDVDIKLSKILKPVIQPSHMARVIPPLKAAYGLQELLRDTEDGHLSLLSLVYGDIINTCPVRYLAETYANRSLPVFLYSFDHVSSHGGFAPWTGARHGSDMDFEFGSPFRDRGQFTVEEAKLSERIMTYYSNFAKFGHPTPEQEAGEGRLVAWPKLSRPGLSELMSLSPHPTPITLSAAKRRRCAFWKSLPKDYFLPLLGIQGS